MRAWFLCAAVVSCLSVAGAERPRFADMQAGDAVVAVVQVSSCMGNWTSWRVHFQKREHGLTVSACDLQDRKKHDGWIGELVLEQEDIVRLDRSLETLRTEQSHDSGSVKISYFWQRSGIQTEEKWEDPKIYQAPDGYSIFRILHRLERFAKQKSH